MTEDSKPSKMDRFKKHLRDNRKVYIVGGVCLIVGATVATIIVTRKAPPTKLANDVASKAAINGVAVHSPVTSNTFNMVVANMPENSTPSKIVQCLEDGWIEPSIGRAADRAATSRQQLSAHLNNRVPHIKGKHYAIIDKIDPNVAEELMKMAKATEFASAA